jgi:hypothetical protein
MSRAAAVLEETEAGWTLTVTVAAASLAAFVGDAAESTPTEIELPGLVVTVSPNLVPGEPFVVEKVQIVVVEDHEAPHGIDGVDGR